MVPNEVSLLKSSLCDSVLEVNEHIFWLFLLACSTVLNRNRLKNLIQIRIRLILMSFNVLS